MCETGAVSRNTPEASLPPSPSQLCSKGKAQSQRASAHTSSPISGFSPTSATTGLQVQCQRSPWGPQPPPSCSKGNRTLPKMRLFSSCRLCRWGGGPQGCQCCFRPQLWLSCHPMGHAYPQRLSGCWPNGGSRAREFSSCLTTVSSPVFSLDRDHASRTRPPGSPTTVLHPSAATSKTWSSSVTHVSAISTQLPSTSPPHSLPVTAPPFHL